MKLVRALFLFFVTLSSLSYGDCFEKNNHLINSFRDNNLKIIVLHTYQSTHNILGIVTSSSSPAYCLTPDGIEDLQNNVPILAAENISLIYTSPTFRAQQTTNLLGIALSLSPSALKIDTDLVLQNLGDFDGMDFDLYKESFGSMVDLLTGTPPHGESGHAVYQRTTTFLKKLTAYQNQTILIVTHGFNFCHISKILTGKFEHLPYPGDIRVYDFTLPVPQ